MILLCTFKMCTIEYRTVVSFALFVRFFALELNPGGERECAVSVGMMEGKRLSCRRIYATTPAPRTSDYRPRYEHVNGADDAMMFSLMGESRRGLDLGHAR